MVSSHFPNSAGAACISDSLTLPHCCPPEFPFGVALFEVLTFIELLFSFADRQGHFYFSVLPIEGQGDESIAFDRGKGEKLADFRFMQQELSWRLRLVVLDIAVRVFINVGVVEPDFILFHAGECVRDLPLARAQSFYFRAVQDDPDLKRFEDVIIAPAFVIGHNVRHGRK